MKVVGCWRKDSLSEGELFYIRSMVMEWQSYHASTPAPGIAVSRVVLEMAGLRALSDSHAREAFLEQ